MSVLIKGMKMPKSCSDCAFCDYEQENCLVNKERNTLPHNGKRPDWCPLVEIPAHGRLIDGDELADGCDAPHWCRWLSEIEDAPTIIEAEEGQEGGDAE